MRRSDTKKRIIEKATELFYHHGFVKASIRDIVQSVGVTNSTVYIHFKNKDEILFSIIEDIGSLLLKQLTSAIEKHDDPLDCLREMIFRQVHLIKDKRKEIKILMEEQYQLPDNLRKRALQRHRQIYDLYYNKISELEAGGLLRSVDKTVAAFSLFGMINWSYKWFEDKKRLTIEEVAEHVVNIFLGGILKGEFLQNRWPGLMTPLEDKPRKRILSQ